MAESANERLFRTKVRPIMDKVMADLRNKQLEEIGRHTSSLPYIFAGAAGPDGGMSAQAASIASLRYTGEWNSKHTEDYINMVKAELKRQKITVTPEIEKMMIDKMIKDEVPKSSIDYIIRKAATNTIFYLPQALNKSPLENHISEQAEKRYNPNHAEKAAGLMLGATADYLSFGGIGGTLTGGAKFVGVDLALNAAMDKMTANIDTSYTPASPGAKPSKPTAKTNATTVDDDVPMIIAPEYREQYKAEQAKRKAEEAQRREAKATPKATTQQTKEDEVRQEPHNEVATQTPDTQTTQATMQEQPQQTNQNGWNGLLSSFGLNGISDIGNNLGYVLAMLPDMLVGAFTGKTSGWWYEHVWSSSSWTYAVIYFLMIFFFSWFYSTIQYDPVEISNNLKKNGGFIPGFRPGKPTAEFIQKVINKIVVFGAVYLGVVALLPIVAGNLMNGVRNLAIGGTSIIIVVGVALETVKALEAQMLMRHYKGFLD